MTNPSPTQDSEEQLIQILTDLYYAQSRLTGTSTDPGTSRGAQLRKAKAALIAWRDQEVVKERATLESEIAYAIGYARSLGEPCEYLEKRYPNLTTKEEQINE